MTDPYFDFLARKAPAPSLRGLEAMPDIDPALFPHARYAVEFALRRGAAAVWLDTGMAKTSVQLEYGRIVSAIQDAPFLILAPLAVTGQIAEEGKRFGIAVTECERQDQVRPGINVTNYERLDAFDPSRFAGVALDESSILKSFTGATKRALVAAWAHTRFRIAATATPAPNDYMELGNHAEFLGVMAGSEMLTRWFINDTAHIGTYRLKAHAIGPFWDWVTSWAVCAARPSDLGFDDVGFVLPPLEIERNIVRVDSLAERGDTLFRMPDLNATGLHKEKRLTAPARAAAVAARVAAEPDEAWLVWCDTNYEADALRPLIPDFKNGGAVEVRGSDAPAAKKRALLGFGRGEFRVLLTKPEIAGFGMNYQRCARMAFAGVGYSYEQLYQALRRCWRFGQTRPVKAAIFLADTEMAVWDTLERKRADHERMKTEMFDAARRANATDHEVKVAYRPTVPVRLPVWLRQAS